MTTNVPLLRTPGRRGSLLYESGPIHLVSFYYIARHNSLIITEGLGLRCLHTSIFIQTPSLEGLPTKAKEDLMRWDYAPLDINPVFPGLGKVVFIIIIITIIIIIIIIIKNFNVGNDIA